MVVCNFQCFRYSCSSGSEILIMSPPSIWGRHIVFGSIIVFCIVISVVFVCVIPCDCNNLGIIWNYTFGLKPGIGHIKVSDRSQTISNLVTLTLIFKVKLALKHTVLKFWFEIFKNVTVSNFIFQL